MLCLVLGAVIGPVKPKRKRTTLANLKAAFPEKGAAWRQKIYREHSRRVIETGLLVLILPHLRKARLRQMFAIDAATRTLIEARFSRAHPARAAILGIPHLTLTEAITVMPALLEHAIHPTSAIFRPLASPKLDRWVKETRSQHGVQLLSRKEGYTMARRGLREGETVGVLFDQKAGRSGALLSFFGRPASSTELPGILAEHYAADVFGVALERTGFFRAQLKIEPIACEKTAVDVTLALNDWLERYVSSTDERTADWLWMHDRWGNYKKTPERLRLDPKRNLLIKHLKRRGLGTLERRTNVWMLLPEDARLLRASEALLARIRAARPDFALTLCSRSKALKLLCDRGLAERVVYIDPSPRAARRQFAKLREDLPETVFVFEESTLADLLAQTLHCPQRIGISRKKGDRPRLTDAVKVGAAEAPQTPAARVREWTALCEQCGLPKAETVPPNA